MRRILTAAALVVVAACTSEPLPVGPPVVVGGVTVSGETMRHGAKVYAMRCATCHGSAGDGNGPTGRAQSPKPRDFRLGLIKFASVPAGTLATDADYGRTIHRGLKGTNMLALPLAPSELEAVTQYVKSLSPKWTDPTAKAGTPVVQTPDPWSDHTAAVARGEVVIRSAGCTSCHATATNEGTGSESVYGTLKAPKLAKLTPKAGATDADLYRTIAAGVGGTKMAGMKDVLSESDLWAVVHAVQSVIDR